MVTAIYHAGKSETQSDGAIVHRTQSHWGDSLVKVENCRWESLQGEPCVTAYATGEPDTYFSIPAACSYKGVRVRGYITGDDNGNLVFRHCYY